MTDTRVIMLITEEYGYRHWLAVMTPDEFAAFEARWKTMKGLYCTVPVSLVVPGAEISSREEHIAAEEQAAASGDKIVRAHIHESEDSGYDGCDHRIPESDNFEIAGEPYTREEISKLYDAANERLREGHWDAQQNTPMPTKAVTKLILLRNELIHLEGQIYNLRRKINWVLDDFVDWLKETDQLKAVPVDESL